MIFYGLNKKDISNKCGQDGDFYEFVLGNSVEITSLKNKHVNNILARNLSSSKEEDKLMIRYYPTNKVYFSKDFIDGSDSMYSSCLINQAETKVFVAVPHVYPIDTGILTLSATLSLNNKVERSRILLCNSQMNAHAQERIKVLACGLREDKLLALFYIPSERGLALTCDDGVFSISAKSLSLKDYSSWEAFTLADWFKNVRIKEL